MNTDPTGRPLRKQQSFINVIAPGRADDIKYAQKLLEIPHTIQQSELRDNMMVSEYDEDSGELRVILRSAKLEREYEELKAGVTALKVEPIAGIPGTIDPFKMKLDKELRGRTINISRGDVPFSIEILSPKPASAENDNLSDADYALKVLQGWDGHSTFMLRGNMNFVKKEQTAQGEN